MEHPICFCKVEIKEVKLTCPNCYKFIKKDLHEIVIEREKEIKITCTNCNDVFTEDLDEMIIKERERLYNKEIEKRVQARMRVNEEHEKYMANRDPCH